MGVFIFLIIAIFVIVAISKSGSSSSQSTQPAERAKLPETKKNNSADAELMEFPMFDTWEEFEAARHEGGFRPFRISTVLSVIEFEDTGESPQSSVSNLVGYFLAEVDPTGKDGIPAAHQTDLDSMIPRMQDAVNFKRAGKYYESTVTNIKIAMESGFASTTLLRNMFKVTAASGDVVGALRLINLASEAYTLDCIRNGGDIYLNKYELDKYNLVEAMQSKESLKAFLKDMSSQFDYKFPLPYKEIKENFDAAFPNGVEVHQNVLQAFGISQFTDQRTPAFDYFNGRVSGFEKPGIWVDDNHLNSVYNR